MSRGRDRQKIGFRVDSRRGWSGGVRRGFWWCHGGLCGRLVPGSRRGSSRGGGAVRGPPLGGGGVVGGAGPISGRVRWRLGSVEGLTPLGEQPLAALPTHPRPGGELVTVKAAGGRLSDGDTPRWPDAQIRRNPRLRGPDPGLPGAPGPGRRVMSQLCHSYATVMSRPALPRGGREASRRRALWHRAGGCVTTRRVAAPVAVAGVAASGHVV